MNKELFSGKGRLDRETFTIWYIRASLGLILVTIVAMFIAPRGKEPYVLILLWAPFIWINAVAQIKRLHDLGKSGGLVALYIIPMFLIVGNIMPKLCVIIIDIIFIWLSKSPGEKCWNEYGEVPQNKT